MKLPRDVSGAEVVRMLCREFGYTRVAQAGSHVILHTANPRSHRLSVPDHKVMRTGTLHGIVKAVAGVKDISIEDVVAKLR
jgi:predicted RNA binding protein YcfA (HicA-like mRNA interferase family)